MRFPGVPANSLVKGNVCGFRAEFEDFRSRIFEVAAKLPVRAFTSRRVLPNSLSESRNALKHAHLPGIFDDRDDGDVLARDVLGAYDFVPVQKLNFELRGVA